MIGAIVRSARPYQWVKNVVLFAPLIFAGQLLDPDAIRRTCLSLVVFCLASGGTYIVNDLADRRVDRFHPTKKRRPIAAGTLSVPVARVAAAVFLGAAILLAWELHPSLARIVGLFLLLNLAYSLWLKRWVIVDVMALSLGFVLRIWGGAVVIDVVPSHWLQLSIFFLALFISLTKRRQELVHLHAKALRHRKVLSNYSAAFIDQMTAILTAVVILCYALYTVSPEVTHRLGTAAFIYTVPFVVYAMFRYLYLVHIRKEALDPSEALLSDRPMLLSTLAWTACVILILYR